MGRKVTLTGAGYPSIKYKGKRIYVHHIVAGTPLNGLMVDHINGDKLDNRRENLRIVDRRQNGNNRKSHRQGRLAGTTRMKDGRWQAQVRVHNRRVFIGRFLTELDAHKAYIKYIA